MNATGSPKVILDRRHVGPATRKPTAISRQLAQLEMLTTVETLVAAENMAYNNALKRETVEQFMMRRFVIAAQKGHEPEPSNP